MGWGGLLNAVCDEGFEPAGGIECDPTVAEKDVGPVAEAEAARAKIAATQTEGARGARKVSFTTFDRRVN